MAEPLSKIDSAVAGLSISETKDTKGKKAKDNNKAKDVKDLGKGPAKKEKVSAEVFNINDLEKDGVELKIAPETQKLNWKLNTSPASLDDKDTLKKPLTNPLVKKIDLRFPLGLEVTARNLKGVTIKDALDAIYKQFKKKVDLHFCLLLE
jgi:hypothetical protein